MNKYAFILGRKHLLSIAELCNTLSAPSAIEEANSHALIADLKSPIPSPRATLQKLGGVIKICKVTAEITKSSGKSHNQATYPAEIAQQLLLFFEKEFKNHQSKISYGLSVYNFPQRDEELIKKILIRSKQLLKEANFKSRFINKNFTPLKNPAIKSEKLIEKGAEFCVINAPGTIYITVTKALQDYESYSHRDYDRPERDPRLGMLPPKLAQIMINLSGLNKIDGRSTENEESDKDLSNFREAKAVGEDDDARKATPTNTPPPQTIFDPFCGIGTVLQEALLMGYKVAGSDIEAQNIVKTEKNLKWLADKYNKHFPAPHLFTKDATKLTPEDLPTPPDAIITESYLGPPVSKYPSEDNIKKTFSNIEFLQIGFFKQIKAFLPPKAPIIISLPAYSNNGKIQEIPELPNKIQELGYTMEPLIPHSIIKKFNLLNRPADNLIYDRPQQIVARNIYKFTTN